MNLDDLKVFRKKRDVFDKLCFDIRHRKGSPRSIYTCPCCGYPTLKSRAQNEMCPLCLWFDEGQDDEDAHKVYGTVNFEYSLTDARDNFMAFDTMYFVSESSEEENRYEKKVIKSIIILYDLISDTKEAYRQESYFEIIDLLSDLRRKIKPKKE